MPFNQVFPRTFNAPSVREYAPSSSGVYGITSAAAWIYIGDSDNIQDSLMAHLTQPDDSMDMHHPTGFVYEVCDRSSRSGRRSGLALEYDPICNRRPSRSRYDRAPSHPPDSSRGRLPR